MIKSKNIKSDGRRGFEMKICGSERDRNQWPSRYSGGSGAGSIGHTLRKLIIQHHTPSTDLESTREEEERPALQQLGARH